jgi:hypothetical protein
MFHRPPSENIRHHRSTSALCDIGSEQLEADGLSIPIVSSPIFSGCVSFSEHLCRNN